MVRIRSFPIVLSCLYHFTWTEYDNVVQCIDIASSARVDVRAYGLGGKRVVIIIFVVAGSFGRKSILTVIHCIGRQRVRVTPGHTRVQDYFVLAETDERPSPRK